MASYFFELRSGDGRLKDECGYEFSTARQAESYGRLVAFDLARNHAPERIADLYLVVTDENGEDLARIDLIEASGYQRYRRRTPTPNVSPLRSDLGIGVILGLPVPQG